MKKCLVIDDVEVTRFTVKNFLEELGATVTVLNNGETVSQTIQSTSFDCVFLDWHLRKKSGLDLMQDIHSIQPNLPVFIMSGVEAEEKAQEAVTAGAKGFLRKPITKDMIASYLSKI